MPARQHSRCKVLGCINQKKPPPPGTGLFLVPSSASREVFGKWVELTGNEELCEVPIDHLRRNLRLCELHFRPDQFSPPTSKLKRLLARGISTVVPTRFADNHVPIPCERIQQWRQSEHYNKVVWDSASDAKCNQCKEPHVTKVQVGAGGISSGTKLHQVPVQPASADDILLIPRNLGGQLAFKLVVSPTESKPLTLAHSVGGGEPGGSSSTQCSSSFLESSELPVRDPVSTPSNHAAADNLPSSTATDDTEVLAQPLPDDTPTVKREDEPSDTFLGKRKRKETGPTPKRLRPSVATVRKTCKKVAEECGLHDVDLTPHKKHLCQALKKTQEQLLHMQSVTNQLEALTKADNLDLLLQQITSPCLRGFITGHIRNSGVHVNARRWTLDEKISALSIFKRSPKGYRYLYFLLVLPSVRCLQRLLRKLPLSPGVNRDIMKHCAKKVNQNNPRDKCVILMFDEMFIKKRLILNPVTGLIEGYGDFGWRINEDGSKYHHRENFESTHALVFMVQGLGKKFKQPVGFHFVDSTVDTSNLHELILEYITALEENGFHVVATVCDQGATNRAALKHLMSKTDGGNGLKEGYFRVGGVEGRKVWTLYDVPHLFKNLRNNFMSSRYIIWNNITAKFQDILTAFKLEKNIFRCKKLTLKQVVPKGKRRMKVKWAAKTLSRSVKAFLKALSRVCRKGRLSKYNFGATADVIGEFDKLFDSVNGPSGPSERISGRRENVSEGSFHFDVWDDMMEKIDKMEFWKYSKKRGKLVLVRPPCQWGFVHTIRNIRNLWGTLHDEYGFQYLNLRQLNQDPIENLFGLIRQHGITCDNPTVGLFIAAMKTSIITNLTSYQSRGANTEADNIDLLSDLRELLLGNVDAHDDDLDEPEVFDLDVVNCILDNDSNPARQLLKDFFGDDHLTEEELQEDMSEAERVLMLGDAHVAGFLGAKITSKLNCADCKQCFKATEMTDAHAFTLEKEYNPDNPAQFYASDGFNNLVASAARDFQEGIVDKKKLHLPQIMFHTKNILALQDFSWIVCPNVGHFKQVVDLVLENLSLMLLRTACKRRCEEIVLEEEAVKKAREAERGPQLQAKAKKQAAARAKKAALEEAKEKKRREREEKREEAIAVKAVKKIEAYARKHNVDLTTAFRSRTPTRAERILSTSSNVWYSSPMN